MFKTVAQWLKSDNTQKLEADNADELAGLVTALMVEAALADGTVAGDEAALTANVIAQQFDLSAEKARQMTNEAIEARQGSGGIA